MRLNRFLARSGVTSRRKAEDLILEGTVKLNGKVVTNLATTVGPQDVVSVADKIVRLPKYKYYLLNKPVGYTVTKKDPHAKKTIYEIIPKDPSLFSVGRLDRDSQGLILITNDGDFAQNIIHPKNKIEKEYIVTTLSEVNSNDINILEKGVLLEDGMAKPKSIKTLEPKKAVIIITEGRKRQVRRMFEKINNKVVELERTRIGIIKLDVKPGQYRDLTQKEVLEYV